MFFIQRNEFENVFCKMVAILYRPQCVDIPKHIELAGSGYSEDGWGL